MKYRHILMLLAAAAVAGCQKDEKLFNSTTVTGPTFTAHTESFTGETRTSLDEDWNVVWKKSDQVSIFAGIDINEQYQVSDKSEGKTTASMQKLSPSGGFVSGNDLSANVAYYPYSEDNEISETENGFVLSACLPSIQNYAEGSFGNGAFPMVAATGSTDDFSLKFKNVLGGIKLQLKGAETIRSISFKGNGNEVLCGPATVTAGYGILPSVELSTEGGKEITLDCGEGVQLNPETATDFIIALPPVTFTRGFTVLITDIDDKLMIVSTNKERTINRSSILKMAVVTSYGEPDYNGHEFVDLGLSVKWATMNVGAGKPEEYGDYFAWGETLPKTTNYYNWSNYKHSNGRYNALTKYCYESSYGYNGYTDSKTVLDPEDDAAQVNWGGNWRIPSKSEFDELLYEGNCYWEWTTLNGVKGYKITSKVPGYVGNWIFLPCAGFLDNNGRLNGIGAGEYSSSSISSIRSIDAYGLDIRSGSAYIMESIRYCGSSVRPVCTAESFDCVHGISLNISSLSLQIGETAMLAATISSGNTTNNLLCWNSDDTAIATVDANGKVTAVSTGSTIITVTSSVGGYTADCNVTVTTNISIYEYVDLGLSVKWATKNIGATSTEDFGHYFAWGETTPKSDYNWFNYQYCYDEYDELTKYCSLSNYGYNGYTDAQIKTVLDLDDDAAHANWGGNWRMPTKAELDELINPDNCTLERITLNGTNGCKITSKISGYEGNWIFLPAAGRRLNSGFSYIDSELHYWSSSLCTSSPESAWYFEQYSHTEPCCRFFGLPVRPVCQPESDIHVDGISLKSSSLSLPIGESEMLTATLSPINATNKTLNWASNNLDVATVDSNGTLIALTPGSATISVTTSDGGYTAYCYVSVIYDPTSIPTTHEFVDLGLSVKWATMNVGACTPHGLGYHFAWGETEPKTDYALSTYKYCNGSSSTLTKYCNDSSYGYNGYTDTKTVLDPEDDAASVNWGGAWRMPTGAEVAELSNTSNCTWTWTTLNGINGYKVTSKLSGYAGNWIFLPAAGYRDSVLLYYDGSYGGYWFSSLYTGDPGIAYGLGFNSDDVVWSYDYRYFGQPVRPVCP